MTQTNEQLDDFLAREVMGWKINSYRNGELYAITADGHAIDMFWHPTTDIAQAKDCLDAWHNKSTCNISTLYRNGNNVVVTLDDGNIVLASVSSSHEGVSRAICLAIYEAYCVSLVSTRELTEEEQEYAMKIDLKPYEKYMKGGE